MRGHPRANGSASRWKKLSTYTQARSPPPRTLPPLPPPDLDEEGRVDNQRNTPHNTPLTVQLTVATSHCGSVPFTSTFKDSSGFECTLNNPC